MPLVPTEELDKVTPNRYEAVIAASKHARFLNSQRLAKLALLGEEDADVDVDTRKITMVAFKDLLDGKVKFERADIE